MSRPTSLRYTGNGSRWFPGVPVRDLDANDIAQLTDAQIADITGPDPDTGVALYEAPAAAKAAKSGGKESVTDGAE